MATVSRSFASRTLSGLRERWRERTSGQAGVDDPLRVGEGLEDANDQAKVRSLMEECLAAKGGEVSARTRARRLAGTWLRLTSDGRVRFLTMLAEEFAVDHAQVRELAAELVSANPIVAIALEQRLRGALAARRRGLIRQLAAVPAGMKLIIDMRAELLDHLGAVGSQAPTELKELDSDFYDLLADWFDVGFLELRRISWDSPASLLEKVIAYEAVHRIDSWADLRNRLDADRRCFGFFHPRMPEEPLIFVEVALGFGVASSVQELLDLDAPQSVTSEIDTAVFYSISNAQAGLRGVGFGDFLIKRVVEDLQRELPSIKHFVTLSPLPGLRRWFTGTSDEEIASIIASSASSVRQLRDRLSQTAEPASIDMRADLLRVAAGYLLRAKRGDHPVDPVARFHLGNGARVERLNWDGDTSTKGLKESFGLMVNYRYELDHIEANHEAFATDRQVVAAKAITDLLEQPKRR
jgi:malonyl-CoA decarboxylase